MSKNEDQDVVNIGKVLAAVSSNEEQLKKLTHTVTILADQVMKLRQQIKRLPCMDDDGDTDPDCPAVLSDMPPHRDRLRSISDDEPDSVVTRPISVHAGMVTVRGPGIMIGIVVVLLGLIAGAVLVFRPAFATWMH
jgi:hypothetical protein